ncbi:MAG: hypothetical protein U9Q82_00250, partial [Chloroflexota bacterium]|nr:hypothetical protein [Chloroflexota bacterium]
MKYSATFNNSEHQRKSHILRILLFSFGTFVAIGVVLSIIRSLSLALIGTQIALLLLLAMSYNMLRLGKLRLASIIFLVGWVLSVVGSLLPPCVPPLLFLIIPYILTPAVIASGMLITPRTSLLAATVTTILVLITIA